MSLTCGEYSDDLVQLDLDYVVQVARALKCDNFGDLHKRLRAEVGGRSLTRHEKGYITSAVHLQRTELAQLQRDSDSVFYGLEQEQQLDDNVLLVTAYSDDYSIGRVCEKVNQLYASKHGYEFVSEVLPLNKMADLIAPKKHCTWYKIALLRRLLNDTELLRTRHVQYIMWVDADAIIVDHSIALKDIIQQARGRDLIIAEDMNPCCLINAGVFMLRTTHWSRQFVEEGLRSSH